MTAEERITSKTSIVDGLSVEDKVALINTKFSSPSSPSDNPPPNPDEIEISYETLERNAILNGEIEKEIIRLSKLLQDFTLEQPKNDAPERFKKGFIDEARRKLLTHTSEEDLLHILIPHPQDRDFADAIRAFIKTLRPARGISKNRSIENSLPEEIRTAGLAENPDIQSLLREIRQKDRSIQIEAIDRLREIDKGIAKKALREMAYEKINTAPYLYGAPPQNTQLFRCKDDNGEYMHGIAYQHDTPEGKETRYVITIGNDCVIELPRIRKLAFLANRENKPVTTKVSWRRSHLIWKRDPQNYAWCSYIAQSEDIKINSVQTDEATSSSKSHVTNRRMMKLAADENLIQVSVMKPKRRIPPPELFTPAHESLRERCQDAVLKTATTVIDLFRGGNKIHE